MKHHSIAETAVCFAIRSRHTRCGRDWSSDVCSSDLTRSFSKLEKMVNMDSPSFEKPLVDRFARFVGSRFEALGAAVEYVAAEQIGRRSCRERVQNSADAVSLKKKMSSRS